MKTKEIECWVHKDAIGTDYFTVFANSNVSPREFVPARLIIDLPERKIEITESQFDEAAKLYELHNHRFKTFSDAMDYVKEKLFGKDEG